jgi:Maintenance of mitochondrial structure and function
VEGWKLETSDAEQIAVERVVRERPPNQSSAFVSQTESVQDSLQKMKDRMGTLLAFLEDTEAGKIPVHRGLLRQVQGLTCQLGCLMGAAPKMDAPQLMQHMAVITKAVHTVKGYTEKYKLVQEAKVSSRERRF